MKLDMSWIKKFIYGIFYFTYLLVVVFVLLEIVFRILPTSDSLKTQPVDKENRILHFQPNQTIQKQIGFDFSHVNKKNINNFGYATDLNFKSERFQKNKLITVIGDSYVEALQVKNQDSFHGIMQQMDDDFIVYPIGVSGAPLSQYLAFSDFAKEMFNPDIYIFLLIENDFHESWKHTPGFHHFNEDGDLELVYYQPSALKSLARSSALLRYLQLDLKIFYYIKQILKNDKVVKSNSNMEEQTEEDLGYKAIEFFLKKINEISKNNEVIIITDGDRRSIYMDQLERNNKSIKNRWFQKVITQLEKHSRIKLLDLHPIFLEDWRNNKLKFNYEYDYHWNEYGHRVAAQALIMKLKNNN